jgi:hypothetical protein
VAQTASFEVGAKFAESGPWDETEPLIWVRCKKCGCTNRFEADDPHAALIIDQSHGLRKHGYCRMGVQCNCHSGIYPLPQIMVKREVA